MVRRFFILIFQLIVVAFLICFLTAIWIVFDGMSDLGEHADVALVTGHSDLEQSAPEPAVQDRLDRAIELYKEGQFPVIVVSGATRASGYDEAAIMAKYLEAHDVPVSAIIQDNQGDNTQDTAHDLAVIMKVQNFRSVMIVSHYYLITRMKLALRHEGITEIQKVHVGKLQNSDAYNVAREVVAFYAYIGKYYIIPTAEKIKEEAEVAMGKAKVDAAKAKETVNKKLDSLPQ